MCRMAKMRPFLFLLLTSLCIFELCKSDSGVNLESKVPEVALEGEQSKCQNDPSKDALVKELGHIKTQLSALEQSLLERDSLLQEKDKAINLFQDELEALQKKDGGELEVHLRTAHAKIGDLEGKFANLEDSLKKKELELHRFKERVQNLEAAEIEHLSKYKKLEKIAVEQKSRIEKAEKALRVAEAAMQQAQAEANAKEQELFKVHGYWLPPWAAKQIAELQASAAKHWATRGEPLLNTMVDKVSEKAAAVQDWSKPHFEMMRMHVEQKWRPVLRQNWEKVTFTVAPHVETVKSKAAEGYEASKAFISPQVAKAQEVIEPYVQAAREVSRPYVEKVAVVVRPHFESVLGTLRPYTEKAAQGYRSFLTSATKYHHQLQSSVRRTLKKNELFSPLASRELVWFLASALLVLPIFGILLFFSSAFGGKKASKPTKSTGSHGHRKSKRSKQVDK